VHPNKKSMELNNSMDLMKTFFHYHMKRIRMPATIMPIIDCISIVVPETFFNIPKDLRIPAGVHHSQNMS